MTRVEPLEARVAPATILPGNKVLVYTEIDGDSVKLTFSKPILANVSLTFSNGDTNSADPQQLQFLDVSEGSITGFDIKMTVKRGPSGDGLADIGYIQATGKDLGVVSIIGDLGRIVAGDNTASAPGVKSLKVHSLGARGLDTQASGGDLTSTITGGLGSLDVKTDLGGEFNVFGVTGNAASGKIGNALIGGSIDGGSAPNSGQIFTSGKIAKLTVKGDVIGGAGVNSGQISAGGSIGYLVVGGSLLGGAGGGTAGNDVSATKGSGAIIVGRDLSGSTAKIMIGGDMRGGAGVGSGSILVNTAESSLGSVTVKGSIIGGSADYSGMIRANEGLAKLSVGGSIVGLNGNYSFAEEARGQIYVTGHTGPISVKGDIIGGPGTSSGRISLGGEAASITIGGSLVAGSGANTGSIESDENMGHVLIKGNVDGSNLSGGAPAGVQSRQNLASVKVGGFVANASITAERQLGAVTIGGNLTDSIITGLGQEPATTKDIAIKSLTVKGSVRSSQIFAGYNGSLSTPWQNGDAQIGAVKVGGDWFASSISAGIDPTDGNFGNGNDVLAASDDQDIASRIASITIGGAVYGSPDSVSSTDSFAFTAQEIGSFKLGGAALKLDPQTVDSFALSLVTGDVFVVELGS